MALKSSDEPFDASAFDHITCPVCGCEDWHERRFEGVFCDDCNCKASLRPTNGDRGFVVDFDAAHCWAKIDEGKIIPQGEGGSRTAYAKYMGTPEDGFSRAYLGVYAFIHKSVPRDAWDPAWDRDAGAEQIAAD